MTPDKLREEAVAIERMHGETLTVEWRLHMANLLRAHAAALEEVERLREDLTISRHCHAKMVERAEKAERRAERLKVHAEAMAARIEWYAEEGWVNGDIPEARAYRAEFKEE